MGKFKKPRGRPPLHSTWDPENGRWEFNVMSAEERRREIEVERFKPKIVPGKRYRNAYTLFIMEHRRRFKSGRDPASKAFRALKFGRDQHAVLVRMWREAPEEERKKYHVQANIEKEAYKAVKRDYTTLTPRTTLQELVDAEHDPPKRPPAAFLLFVNDQREKIKTEIPGIASISVIRAAKDKWAALTESERNVYSEKHRELYAAFAARMAPIRRKHEAIVEAEQAQAAVDVAQEKQREAGIFEKFGLAGVSPPGSPL